MAAGFDAASAEDQGMNATELAAMVKRGLTSLEVIQAATINAAELFGLAGQSGSARTRPLRGCGAA